MRARRYLESLSGYSSFMNFRPIILGKQALNFVKYSVFSKGLSCYNLPITLQVEPTLRCNLKCTMCVREHFEQGEMSLESFKSIVSQLEGSLLKIHLQGLGEPFLNRDIFSMIDYASRRNILVSVITNGTLFNDSLIDKIVESNIFEMGISIDATDKKSYEKIRVGANFDKLIAGVRQLSKRLRDRKKRTRVFFAVTLLKSNLYMIPEFVKLAHSVGIKRIVFQRVQTKEDFISYYKEDFMKSKEFVSVDDVKRAVNAAMGLAQSFGVEILFEERRISCVWPWRGMYITWKGDVTPCCMVINPKTFVIGNVFKESIRKVWNSRQYKQLRFSMLKRKALPICRGCRAF